MEVVIKGPDEYANIIAQQIQLCANRSCCEQTSIELIQRNGQLELLEQVTINSVKQSDRAAQQAVSQQLRHNIDVAQFVKFWSCE